MKKLAIFLCLMLCAMTVMGSALAASRFTADLGDMKVVNCKNWVSLRKSPSTSAKRLDKVSLGEIVTDCHPAKAGFVECTYKGQKGYILMKYLERVEPQPTPVIDEPQQDTPELNQPEQIPAEPTEAPAADSGWTITPPDGDTAEAAAVQPAPVPAEEPENTAETLINEWFGDYHVEAVRSLEDKTEKLLVKCENTAGDQLWQYEAQAENESEIPVTCAFMGGLEQSPLVLVYNPKDGLSALMLLPSDPLWTIPAEEVTLAGNVVCISSQYGTMYIGSTMSDPIAVSLSGELMWKADSQGCLQLYDIVLDEVGLVCQYGAMDGNEGEDGRVYFDLDGNLVEKSNAVNRRHSSGGK